MDLTWLILFIIIAAVSSVMSKRAEQQAKKQAAEKGDEPPKRRTTATPRSPGPPVAPAPFGGSKPGRPQPEPRPRQPAEQAHPAAPEQRPERTAERADGRDVFQRMRRQLEQRRAEIERAQRAREVDAEFVPARPRIPVSTGSAKSAAGDRQAAVAIPRDAGADATAAIPREGESTTKRLVARAGVIAGRQRSRKFALNGRTLRQAVVMKEILDPPVALRDRVGGWDES